MQAIDLPWRTTVTKIIPFFILVLVAAFLAACGASHPKHAASAAGGSPGVQKGKAVYYSSVFNGKKTASGEIYDESKLTAAHRSLPFNTLVKVTNLKNGKSVVVKINDRGPFGKKERIIDLSLAAARQIGMLKAGVVDVKVEVQKK
jgi:rare lipoprotein A